jgi:hypothetical protein
MGHAGKTLDLYKQTRMVSGNFLRFACRIDSARLPLGHPRPLQVVTSAIQCPFCTTVSYEPTPTIVMCPIAVPSRRGTACPGSCRSPRPEAWCRPLQVSAHNTYNIEISCGTKQEACSSQACASEHKRCTVASHIWFVHGMQERGTLLRISVAMSRSVHSSCFLM